MKNVVIINDFDYIQGGASKVAIDMANSLVEKDYRVIFFSGTHQESKEKSKYENVTLDIPENLKDKNKLRGALRNLYNLKAKKELKKLLKTLDSKETIVHIHGWTKSLSSSIFPVIKKCGFKTVITYHDYFTSCPNGGYFNYPQNKICKLDPLSLKCVCTNCDSRNYGFKLFRVLRTFIQNKIVKINTKIDGGIIISDFSYNILKNNIKSQTKIQKIYNPIVESKKNFEVKEKDFFLFVGRISKEKGIELFCEAVTDAKVFGIAIGDGLLLNGLKEKYPNIKFLGWQNSETVFSYMSKAKALVFPSLWYETAGLTVLEAALCGTYSLVSDVTASTEFSKMYGIGDLFSVNSKNDLVEKLKILKSIPKKELPNVKKSLKTNHSMENYIDNLVEFYKSLR